MSDDTKRSWTDMALAAGTGPIERSSQSPGRKLPSIVEREPAAKPRRGRIALVESDDLIRALVERWLGEEGFSMTRMTIEELKSGNGIDLIVADVPSPRGAAPLIRTLQAAHAAPLLLISARLRRGQGASATLARQLGVAAVLPKPFTRDELLGAVARALAPL